jgi:hypothetical protein
LLDWHQDYYLKHAKPSRGRKNDPLTPTGNLSTSEKKRILLNNIFGVDIDVNAVEVTKLSLLIKCMEGETEASIETIQRLFHEQVLPSIDDNIRDGNSLVDTDFYDNNFDFGDEKKIKPFNWKRAFPEIFKQNGFDCVICNPPYGADFNDTLKQYFLNKFQYQNYQLESYLIFFEQIIGQLLKQSGKCGIIIPNPWLTNLRQKNIRKLVFENTTLNEIVHFRQPVFHSAIVDAEIVVITNTQPKNNIVRVSVVNKGSKFDTDKHEIIKHKQKEWINNDGESVNIFQRDRDKILFRKIQNGSRPLETYFTIHVGIKPYQVGKGKPKQTRKDVADRVFDSDKRENRFFRKYLIGSDINRYKICPIKNRYLKFGEWLAEPRPSVNFDVAAKIFMRQTGDSLIAAMDIEQHLCLNNMHILIPKITTQQEQNIDQTRIKTHQQKNAKINVTINKSEQNDNNTNSSMNNLKYFLGIINSKLLNWYYQILNPEKGETLAEVKKTNVARLPIKIADTKNYNLIVKLVDQLLKLNVEKSETKLPSAIKRLDEKIAYCENKINQTVYQLYGLTDEEIAVVEGSEVRQ